MEKVQNSIHLKIKPSTTRTLKKILVVEDEPSWQAIISHSLHQTFHQNLQIRFVRTAKQALDLIYKEKAFDLIISDNFLDGEMTGIDLWQQVKSQYFNIPFILISGKNLSDVKNEISNLNFYPLILQKPFKLSNFKSLVNIYVHK